MRKVVILPAAAKALRKHPAQAERILKKLETCAADPAAQKNNVKTLAGSTAKRLRIGDFRAMFEETDAEMIVTKIGPRGSFYDQEPEPDAVNVHYMTTPKGEELAILPRADLEALMEIAAHMQAVADYRTGVLPGLSPDQTRALTAAPTPLAFWRKFRGMTQAALAETVGVTQGYLSDVENGRRDGPVGLWLKLSRALKLPVESLIDDD